MGLDRVQQACLADAGLARDERNLQPAGGRTLKQLLEYGQLVPATDQRPTLTGKVCTGALHAAIVRLSSHE